MAIAYLGTGTAAAGSTTPLAVPYPSPISAGDCMVLVITGGSTSSPTLPSGWTAGVFTASSGVTPYTYIAVKIATGSESGNLSVTIPAQATKAQILRFSGVDQSTPIDVAGTVFASSAAVTAYTIPTLTTTLAGAALVAVGSANSTSGSWTNPTLPANSWVKLTDNVTLVPGTYVGYLIWSGSGATGGVDLVKTNSIRGCAGMVALRPAASGFTGTATLSGSGTLTTTQTPRPTQTAALSGSGSLTTTGARGGPGIQLLATGTAAQSATDTVAVPYPAGLTSGDFLMMYVGGSGPTQGNLVPQSTLTGWVYLGAGVSDWSSAALYGRFSDGTESGTKSVSVTNANTVEGQMFRYQGVANPAMLDVSPVTGFKNDNAGGAAITDLVTGRVPLNSGAYSVIAVRGRVATGDVVSNNAAWTEMANPYGTGFYNRGDLVAGVGTGSCSVTVELRSPNNGMGWIHALLRPSTATSFTGTADFTGDGTLSSAQVPKPTQTAALSGSGSLSTSVVAKASGTAALSGSGTLATIQSPNPAQTATLSGSGTLSAAIVSSVLTNLVTNPSFETGLTDWTVSPGTGGVVSTAHGGYSGSQAVKITLASNNAQLNKTAIMPVTAGLGYMLSAAGWFPSAVSVTSTYNLLASVVWLDSVGGFLSSANVLLANPTKDAWVRVSGLLTAPALAAQAQFQIAWSCAPNATGDVWLDAGMFVQATTDPGYFDGSTPPAPPYSYAWTGTANASTSTRTATGLAIAQTAALTGDGTLSASGVASGGSGFTGTATLSGSGTLSAAGTPRPAVTAALSGDGSLTAAGKPGPVQTAALSGAGTLTTSVVPGPTVVASFSGAGTLATAQAPGPTVAASLSGSGTLTTAQAPGPKQTVSLSGDGSLSTSGVPRLAVAVALSGTGTLTTTRLVTVSGAATLTGSGSLTVSQVAGPVQTASLSGSGTLSTAVVPGPTVVAALSGSGTLATSQVPGPAQTVSLTGSGTLSVTQAPSPTVVVSLSGSGTLTTAQVARPTATASLSGSGTLATTQVVKVTATAALSGSGTLVASGSAPGSGSANLSGSGTLTVATSITASRTAALSGSGTLSTAQTAGPIQTAVLSGSGTLTSTQKAGPTPTVSLTGDGTLSATGKIAAKPSAALTGNGTLSTTALVRFAGAATLSGSGTLSAVGAPGQVASASLSGSGTLTVTVKVGAAGSAGLSGTGVLAAAGKPVLSSTAVLSGTGTLAVAVKASAQATADLTGSGTLDVITYAAIGGLEYVGVIPL